MPLQRRVPKFGFKNINRKEYKAINLSTLQWLAEKDKLSKISIQTLIDSGLVSKNSLVKILGNGKLTTKLDIEAHAFDSLKNGYTDALARDWSPLEDLRLSEKDQNESKTMNTHLHILEAYTNLYRVWNDPALKDALENVLRLMLDRFVNRDSKHLNLFFDENWTLKSNLVSFGHDIEATWLLFEAAEVLEIQSLIEDTRKLAVEMARENFSGLDADGGLYYEFFPDEKRMDTDKHWWPQAEALVGYYNAYQISNDEIFLIKALESWTFIKEKLVDLEYGEWNWATNKEGRALREKEKAGLWKCPYHNGRACLEIIQRIDNNLKDN